MAETADLGLSQLEPEGLAAEGSGWQQRKSALTRTTILEAAIDCLERYGYARTTTQLIAQTAGISRGAMLHHYATKQDLIAAVIDYTVYKRMESFIERIRALSEHERIDDHAGIELYWQSLLTREFAAYLELMVAARTDEELREIFLPKARHYDQVERDAVLAVFPEWQNHPLYSLSMDFCIAAMGGLLLNREIWEDPDRQARLRRAVSSTILQMRARKFDGTSRLSGP